MWEYMIEDLYGRQTDSVGMQNWLNRRGKEGWELVSVDRVGGEPNFQERVIFKRRPVTLTELTHAQLNQLRATADD